MTEAHFDEIATVYDESLPAHVVEHYLAKRARFIVERCPPGRALDVGCGTGLLAERLNAAGYTTTGVDPSGGMLDILRSRAPQIEATQASGTALPFEDGSFDLVYCVAVMHHVADPLKVQTTLSEMVRVAKTGGHVLVWDHNPRNPYWRVLMARVPQDTGEERLIPEGEVTAGLEAAGASVVESLQLGWIPDFIPKSAMRPAAMVEGVIEGTPVLRKLAAHNVVLARKYPTEGPGSSPAPLR